MVNRLCLLIEDSQTQARLIGQMLVRSGWSYLYAEAIEGIEETFAAEQPDAILLDLILKKGLTYEQFPVLRKQWPSCALIVMSGGGGGSKADSLLSIARRLGAEHVLKKPFTEERIAHVLDEAVRLRRQAKRHPHVLVIDDSRVLRTIAREALVQGGFRVSVAGSMEEALDDFALLQVDVVLTDIFMPGMGGVAGIHRLRSEFPAVGIVAMTSGLDAKMSVDATLAAALKVGAGGTLSKPFTPEQCVETVRKVLFAGRRAG